MMEIVALVPTAPACERWQPLAPITPSRSPGRLVIRQSERMPLTVADLRHYLDGCRMMTL